MSNTHRTPKIIRWIARIWGTLSLIVMLIFVGAALIASITGKGDPLPGFKSFSESLSFIFFPISIMVGLALAWKWEGLGGLVATLGIIGFHIIRPDLLFDIAIDGLAAPGVLFLIYWFLARSGAKKGDAA